MSSTSPRVSVIVPVHNSETYLAETLDSVVGQTMTDLELIIVDDGSTDGSRAIAEGYAAADPRVRVIHQPNAGVSAARNTGFLASNPASRALIFLDSDDYWEPHALAALSQELDGNPKAAAVYGAVRFFDETGRVWPETVNTAFGRVRAGIRNGRVVSWPVDAPTTFEVLVTWPSIATSGQVLLRREAIPDSVTPFEPRILSEDWLFWLHVTRRGGLMYPLWEFILNKRERSVSLSQGRAFGRSELIMRRKLLEHPELTPAQRRTAWRGHLHAVMLRGDWAMAALREGDPIGAAKQLRHLLLALTDYIQFRAAMRRRSL